MVTLLREIAFTRRKLNVLGCVVSIVAIVAVDLIYIFGVRIPPGGPDPRGTPLAMATAGFWLPAIMMALSFMFSIPVLIGVTRLGRAGYNDPTIHGFRGALGYIGLAVYWVFLGVLGVSFLNG